MADLEELAVKRDRGYLVRLVLGLGAGAVVGSYVFLGMTGENVGDCLARAFVGAPAADSSTQAAETAAE